MIPSVLTLAQLSQMAYGDGVIQVDEIQAFACEGGGFACRIGDCAILVFRGTQSLDDVLVDSLTALVRIKTGFAHAGFQYAASTRLRYYKEALAKLSGYKQLVLTGHSLGGAIATLVAQMIPTDQVVTFGSPRVFDAGAAKAFSVPYQRYVNAKDPIPKVPFWPFCHVGNEVVLGSTVYNKLSTWFAKWWKFNINEHHVAKYVEYLSA